MTTTLTRDDVTITPCACGHLVRLTHRWQRSCSGCGQSIESGAVGPRTWDDCPQGTHGHGTWSHQHGCGTWNTPSEVTEYLYQFDDLDAAIEAGLGELSELVEEEREEERARIRGELDGLLRRAHEHLRSHPGHPAGAVWDDPDQTCEDYDCQLRGGELTPGAFVQHTDPWGQRPGWDELVAWDWDPTSDEGDTIEVSVDVTGLVAVGVAR